MTENLASRVGRIISGSLNSLVDAIENSMPETVMDESIREIEGAIEEVRAELGRVTANKYLASTRLLDENRKHEDLAANIELAIKEGRDDLAEAAISSQLDIEAQIPVLERTISDCGAKEKELEGFISALQAKKREMNDELRKLVNSRKEAEAFAAGGGNSVTDSGGIESRVTKAESAFNRVMERSSGMPGKAGVGDRKSAAQLAELEDMARKNRVQERLAAIKEGK